MAHRMTARQRLLTAIRHSEPDYVPVGPRVWAWVLEHYGSCSWLHVLRAAGEFDFDPLIYIENPYPNYISDLRASCEDLRQVQADMQVERFDTYTLVRRTIRTPVGTLSDALKYYKPNTGYGIDPNPHWSERLVKQPGDIAALAHLLPVPEPARYVDVRAIQDAIGEDALLHVYIHSPLDHQAGWAVELTDLMVDSIERPEFVRDLLALFQQHTLAHMRATLRAGIRAIFVPWYFASLSAGWSPAFYQRFILPLVKEQVALVHELGGLYHYYDDGKMMRILPQLAEAGVDLVSTLAPPPMGDVDLAEAKAEVGHRLCLNGNIDLLNVIKNGTPRLIRDKVRQAILDAAPGGGFILGSSDSIREAPLENVHAYFEAARRYGDYAHLGRAR
jgi:uroporphyrinogen-III decarboxylase